MDKLIASLITASAFLTLDAMVADAKKGIVTAGALRKSYVLKCYLDVAAL